MARIDDVRFCDTFKKAVEQAELTETLKNEEGITVFIPTDRAFARMSQEELAEIMNDPEKLKAFVLAHVTKGEITAEEIGQSGSVQSIEGVEHIVLQTEKGVRVASAKLILKNVEAKNGVIHFVNHVFTSGTEVALK